MQKLKVGVLTTLTVWIAACSPVNFNTVKNDGVGVTATLPPANVCNVENIYRKTKILFLVDTSGSNHDTTYNYNQTGGVESTPATDPSKSFRGGAINDFFSTYRHKTNFSWDFATFAGTTATPLMSGFGLDTAMSGAISNFYNVADSGETPYRPAVSLAANAIANDPQLNSADRPNYMVILLSDGFPTDYTVGGTFQSSQMRSDVAALLAKAPGRVTLNTIFYGVTNSAIAISDLQQMASAGGGQFASVNVANSSFKIEDVIANTSTTCTP